MPLPHSFATYRKMPEPLNLKRTSRDLPDRSPPARLYPFLPLFGALLLTSCQGTSPHNLSAYAEFPSPKKWKADTVAQPSYHPDRFWISDFNDPSLEAFVREALKCNRDIKAAQARIETAANTARITGADIFPQVGGNLAGQRSKQNFIGFPFGGGGSGILSSHSTQWNLSLDTSWEIDLWGRVKAAQSAAIAEMEASQYDRALLDLSIAAQAAKAWFTLAESKDQVKLAEGTLLIFKKTEDSVRDRFQKGVEEGNTGSFGSQLLLAGTDVATAQDALAARKELVSRTSRQLEILAGRYPAGEAGKTARLPSFPTKRPISLPCTVLERRPDLIAAERRLAATDQRLIQAKRALLPTIGLTNSVGTTTERFGDLLNGQFSVWSIAGNIAQPVLQGGRLRHSIQRNQAEMHVAKAEYEQAILTAFAEVENALSAEKFLADRIIALTKAAKLSKESYQRSGEEYINGTGDLLTMLTAQQRMFTQESQLLALKRQQLEARVDLHLALAGSFECPTSIHTGATPLSP